MEKLSSLPSGKDLPEHLYHYTSIDGLEGILTRRSLWAGQIHFLNDSQEFKYSIDILKKVLSEFRKKYPINWLRAIGPSPLPSGPEQLLAHFYNSMENLVLDDLLEKPPICVFSLSERGDLLSQWRGYCPPDGGYSIGFRSELLLQFLETRHLCIEPCVYVGEEQEDMVKRTVTETGEVFLKSITDHPEQFEKAAKKCLVNFFMDFSRIASILKHPSFHEECEWRIVSNLIPNKNMSFRVGKSILIPYLSISFKDIEPFLIDEIIIGPATEQSLAEYSLRQFVLQINPNISIKTSKTPYRQL